VCALALIALALLIVPWNSIFPPQRQVVNAPVAHSSPVPSPSPSPVIQVNGAPGSICIVPTSKAKRPITLVKVP